MNYVNYLGETVSIERLAAAAPKKKPRSQSDSYHNGWRVQGIPPGQLEEARDAHQRLVKMAEASGGKEIKRWDEANYLMNAKRKAVRGKPFEVPGAAQECKALAEKMGWLRVEVVELKKEKAVA